MPDSSKPNRPRPARAGPVSGPRTPRHTVEAGQKASEDLFRATAALSLNEHRVSPPDLLAVPAVRHVYVALRHGSEPYCKLRPHLRAAVTRTTNPGTWSRPEPTTSVSLDVADAYPAVTLLVIRDSSSRYTETELNTALRSVAEGA